MLNKVNVVTIHKGQGVGKVYDWKVGYNFKGAINIGKIRGWAVTPLLVSSNWRNSAAHVLAKHHEGKSEENVVSDLSPPLSPSHRTQNVLLDAVTPDRAEQQGS